MNELRTIKYTTALMAAVFAAMATSAVIKNEPDEDKVEEVLKELGEKHWYEDMDIDDFGSLKAEDKSTGAETYFHIFFSFKDSFYRVIIFDNDQRYIGYYETPLEPVDMEEGAVLVDSGDGSTYYRLPVSMENFPERVKTGTRISKFVKNKKLKPLQDNMQTAEAESGNVQDQDDSAPDYRDWTVEVDGREITFNAVYIKTDGGDIYLKESKRGLVNDFPYHIFSEEDQDYLKDRLLNQ